MKRIAINGSPRGRSSNSRIILAWILDGVQKLDGAAEDPGTIIDLSAGVRLALDAFLSSDEAILAFPLYTDFIPGIVKEFFDLLAGFELASVSGKRLAFVVHSGFPEALHSRPTAAWLERACARLGLGFGGVLVHPGSEGYHLMPPRATMNTAALFAKAGSSLARDGRFGEDEKKVLAGIEKLPASTRLAFTIFAPLGIFDLYWIFMLRKHKAWKRRFDRPFAPEAEKAV